MNTGLLILVSGSFRIILRLVLTAVCPQWRGGGAPRRGRWSTACVRSWFCRVAGRSADPRAWGGPPYPPTPGCFRRATRQSPGSSSCGPELNSFLFIRIQSTNRIHTKGFYHNSEHLYGICLALRRFPVALLTPPPPPPPIPEDSFAKYPAPTLPGVGTRQPILGFPRISPQFGSESWSRGCASAVF